MATAGENPSLSASSLIIMHLGFGDTAPDTGIGRAGARANLVVSAG